PARCRCWSCLPPSRGACRRSGTRLLFASALRRLSQCVEPGVDRRDGLAVVGCVAVPGLREELDRAGAVALLLGRLAEPGERERDPPRAARRLDDRQRLTERR